MLTQIDIFVIQLRLDLDITYKKHASSMNLESVPQFAKVMSNMEVCLFNKNDKPQITNRLQSARVTSKKALNVLKVTFLDLDLKMVYKC